jgi:hypothetical protein
VSAPLAEAGYARVIDAGRLSSSQRYTSQGNTTLWPHHLRLRHHLPLPSQYPSHPSNVVEWSSHTFCTYAICRATLPAQEGLHDIGTHFTHLPLEPLPDSLKRKRKGSAKEPERKSSAVVFTGREEWMDGYVDKGRDEGTEPFRGMLDQRYFVLAKYYEGTEGALQ